MASNRVTRVSGTGVAVRGNDLDTDRIVPARYLKEVTFDRMGEYPFFDERFDESGTWATPRSARLVPRLHSSTPWSACRSVA
jgi:3-isopropylmalate dehydratase small subunit